MKIKMLSIAALSLALIGGVANAQTTSATSPSEGPDPAMQEMWQPLYTDNTFSTARTGDDLRSAYMGLTADQQTAMKANCANSENKQNFWPEGADAVCKEIATF